MFIIGISSFYHDSAACIIKDGEIIAAVQEERFTRIKHDSSFPHNAIKFCLKSNNLELNDIDYVVFYEKPIPKFERLLETYMAYAPKGLKSFSASLPVWVKDKLFQKKKLIDSLNKLSNKDIDWNNKLLFSEHHLSHAASAFYPSPFKSSAILTLDGVGEWTTTSYGIGEGNKIELKKEIHFPHSLGLLYSTFTYYTGFKVNSGEYKLMGLAPYGKPKYTELIKEKLINIHPDGSFQLNMEYFGFCTDLKMTNRKFENLFGGPVRKSEDELTQKEMDLAASIQKVTEDVIIKLAEDIKLETNQSKLCLAGGVALNCVANGVLERKNIFEKIWVQPASGDAGGALGAALSIYHLMLKNPKISSSKNLDSMKGGYLGPEYDMETTENELNKLGAIFEKLDSDSIIEKTAKDISDGKAIGWMNGKMEFGPRALGSRSILADPRSDKMQKQLNLKVKYRESFRPFAPSVLSEYASEWFDIQNDSPYMSKVSYVTKKKRKNLTDKSRELFGIEMLNVARSSVPAVTHVDFSARLQTVHKETNPLYHKLLTKFYEMTGCPILVNTSFNIRGEPIVCNPKDAFRCFMGTDLDILVIGNFYLQKNKQKKKLGNDYKNRYGID